MRRLDSPEQLRRDAKEERRTIRDTGTERVMDVTTCQGPMTVPVLAENRGLAVARATNPDVVDGYVVTHIASGLAIAAFPSQQKAEAAMGKFAELLDWTQPAREILYEGEVVAKMRALAIRHGVLPGSPLMNTARRLH